MAAIIDPKANLPERNAVIFALAEEAVAARGMEATDEAITDIIASALAQVREEHLKSQHDAESP
jgi:hypothetical protein